MLKSTLRIAIMSIIGVVSLFVAIAAAININEEIIENSDHAIENKIAHLQGYESDYLRLKERLPLESANNADKDMPKVVFLCMQDSNNPGHSKILRPRKVDPITAKLPNPLFPEDVDTITNVVYTYWGEKQVGKYDNGAAGMVDTCLIKIFDAFTGKLIDEKLIVGQNPPQRISDYKNGKIYGRVCDQEVIDYVAGKLNVGRTI